VLNTGDREPRLAGLGCAKTLFIQRIFTGDRADKGLK
jgi:hypothetical protein